MISKLDRKWSRTGNDPRRGPQMIPCHVKNKEWLFSTKIVPRAAEHFFSSWNSWVECRLSMTRQYREGHWFPECDCLTSSQRSPELCHLGVNCVSNVLVKMAKLLFLLITVILALVSFVSVLGGDDKNKHEDEREKRGKFASWSNVALIDFKTKC